MRPGPTATRAALGAAFVMATSLGAMTEARAGSRTKVSDICAGCLASVPSAEATASPAPLLVTLHGDWGAMAPELHAAWERFAAPRGVALLSLTCPADLGCRRSWWQWNGSPTWLTDQIDRLAARHPIDRQRVWLAGWSGGATYIGMRTQRPSWLVAAMLVVLASRRRTRAPPTWATCASSGSRDLVPQLRTTTKS